MRTIDSSLETASEKEAARIETTPSETVTADFAYGFIYIDESAVDKMGLIRVLGE